MFIFDMVIGLDMNYISIVKLLRYIIEFKFKIAGEYLQLESDEDFM